MGSNTFLKNEKHRNNKSDIFSAKKVYNLFCWKRVLLRDALCRKMEGARRGLNCYGRLKRYSEH